MLLEDLYAKDKQSDEIVDILRGDSRTGPSFLNDPINELEHLIVQYLGGQKVNLSYLRELHEKDQFFNLEERKITRSEFLKQVKRVIELNLKPDIY